MAILSLIISILSLTLGLYTYLKHDAIIKKQSVQLNEYQLEKIQKEKESNKRAIIEANVIRGDKGKRTLKIYNKGNAIARDVKIQFIEHPDMSFDDALFPIDIKAKHSVDVFLWSYTVGIDKTKISFEWSDDFSTNNIDSQTIQL